VSEPATGPGRLTESRWKELSPLLDRLLDATPSERASILSELDARDALLATDLRSLLDEHRRLGEQGFLEGSASEAPAPATLAGQTVGAYMLRSEIGMGGMGSVWLADRTDGRYSGQVAVKLLSASRVGRQGEARFRREGTILARLRHPHIAHLVDAGVSASGQPYLVLEYVSGQRIDEYCDSHQLGVEARVRLFLDVLSAVSYAHAQLIVHRDIKPSNVLVGADGTVKLLDFGIAKLLEDDSGGEEDTALTREGEMMLTPEYASPEQLRGEPVTTATDVYALGVLLYVLMAGEHPVGPVSSPADLMRAIVEDEAVRLSTAVSERRRAPALLEEAAARRDATPRRLRAALQGDLENIVAKALKKAPAERYPSVSALADDLRRHIEHRPVSARPDSLRYRTVKFVRRNRTAVELGALVVAALAAGLLGTVSQARRATRQAARADEQARSAVAQRDFALLQLGHAEALNELNAYLVIDAVPAGKPQTSRELLARAEEMVRSQEGETAANRAELLLQVGELYQHQQEMKKALPLFEEADALARTQPEPSTRARAACSLADARLVQGNSDAAERLVGEALGVLPQRPEYGVQRAKCLMTASDIAMHRQDSPGGIARALEARRSLRASGMPFVLLDDDISGQLAIAYRVNGRARDAAVEWEASFARLTRLGRTRTDRAAATLNNWALALSSLGRLLEAESRLRGVVAMERTGGVTTGVSPVVLCNLARVLRDLDRLPEAARLAQEAREAAVRLGDGTALWRALMVEAPIYRQMNQLELASRTLTQAETLLRQHEAPGLVSFANAEMEHASLALARGDGRTAESRADRAVEMAGTSGQRVEYVPRLLVQRAQIEVAMGHGDRAEADARRALDLWREAWGEGALSGWVGQAHLVRAQSLATAGKGAEARAAAAEALRHLEPCFGAAHSQTRVARELLGRLAG